MAGAVSKLAGWLTAANRFVRNQSVVTLPLSDNGSALDLDAAKSNNWKITLTGNRTLNAPSNLKEGMILNFAIDQDATGSRVITYNSIYKAATGQSLALSTGASAKDLLCCYYDGTILRCSLGKGYS